MNGDKGLQSFSRLRRVEWRVPVVGAPPHFLCLMWSAWLSPLSALSRAMRFAGVPGVPAVPSGVSRGIVVVDTVDKSTRRGNRRGGVWLLTLTVVCACGKRGICARVCVF